MITDKNGLACQHLQYLPFGEQFVEQRTTATYYTPYKFSAKEKDTETGYSYFGARYYDSDLSLWLSVDPMADQRSWISPYNYCQWNPVMRTDPTGMLDGPPDWVKNIKTGQYEWMDNVTSASNVPTGYKYIGKNNTDILKDLRMNYSFKSQISNRVGYVASDVDLEKGKYAINHMINVKVKSYVKLSVAVNYNSNAKSKNNTLGKVFTGIEIYASIVGSNTLADGDVSASGTLYFKYGGKEYSNYFRCTQGETIKEQGTDVKVTSIKIPAVNLNSSYQFSKFTISGSWWIKNSSGLNTPVIYHPIVAPFPQKFYHNWNFPNK